MHLPSPLTSVPHQYQLLEYLRGKMIACRGLVLYSLFQKSSLQQISSFHVYYNPMYVNLLKAWGNYQKYIKIFLALFFQSIESRIRSQGLLKCLIAFTMYLHITFNLKSNSIYLKYSLSSWRRNCNWREPGSKDKFSLAMLVQNTEHLAQVRHG